MLRTTETIVNPNANPPVQEADPAQTKEATFKISKYSQASTLKFLIVEWGGGWRGGEGWQ